MTRPLLLKFITGVAFISPFLFPASGTAICDLENIPVSLKVINKPVMEILKDMEKQAGYTIEVQSSQALTNKKNIELDQASLDLTIKRLLKNINYSTICNNEKKSLTLVLLDKGVLPSSISATNKPNAFEAKSMEGASKAMDDYRKNKRPMADSPQQEPKEMKGIASAMQSYNKNKEKGIITPAPQNQETSMDGATEAVEQYNANKQNSGDITPAENNNGGGMSGPTNAMNEYRKLDPSRQSAPSAGQPTSMDGATTAMNQYKNLSKK